MRYDTEQLIDEILELVKSNINLEVASIQLEKNTLLGSANFETKLIPSEAYFNSLDEGVTNYNPFIYYGIEDDTMIPVAGQSSDSIKLFVLVVLANDFSDANVYKRLLRYCRALRQIFEKNFDAIPQAGLMKVDVLTPTNFQDLEANTFYKMGGVSISLSLC